jgi:hypothetical protein
MIPTNSRRKEHLFKLKEALDAVIANPTKKNETSFSIFARKQICFNHEKPKNLKPIAEAIFTRCFSLIKRELYNRDKTRQTLSTYVSMLQEIESSHPIIQWTKVISLTHQVKTKVFSNQKIK